MSSLTNNYNNVPNGLSTLTTSVSSFNKASSKNPILFANSAVNLAGSVYDLAKGINNVFDYERDVITQNANIMRGNHYIMGYERLPYPPLPLLDPFSPPSVLEPFLPEVASDVMGMKQDIHNQDLVEYDIENFKYSFDRKDNTDFFYEDPLFISFDIIFDTVSSPLFNGEISSFFKIYAKNVYLMNAWKYYKKFIDLFFKIFNGYGGNLNTTIKQNKVWYISSISGLDKITAKIPKYPDDKITITLTEDIAMLVNYMIDAYNNFVYNYSQQRYNLPDNLLRFKMSIRLTDGRTMKLINHFETPDYIYDKAAEIYTLHDCTFDFFNSKNFPDEIINAGYNQRSDTPATVKIDIIYKSIQKETRTPLIKGERNNIINNKDLNETSSSFTIFRDRLNRTAEKEPSFKDKLAGAYGAMSSLNNLLQNYIPKYQSEIPVPNDTLGAIYNNNIENTINTDDLKNSDIINAVSYQTRKELLTMFMNNINKDINIKIIPETVNLGYNYEPTPIQHSINLGYNYENNNIETNNDLGFISLFLKTPFTGSLGYDYENTNVQFSANLGYDYENVYYQLSTNLGVEYENIGERLPLDNMQLYDAVNTPTYNLGNVYTNLYELRNINLNILYDNTVERINIPLESLYSNLVNNNIIDNLGVDYINEVNKLEIVDMSNVYTNQTTNDEIVLDTLYNNSTNKPETLDMLNIYDGNIINKQKMPDMILFENKEKTTTELNTLYNNTIKKNDTQDMGGIVINTTKENVDFNYEVVNINKNEVLLGEIYDNNKESNDISLNNVYENNNIIKQVNDLNILYDNNIKTDINLNNDIIDVNTNINNDINLGELENENIERNILENDVIDINVESKNKIDLGEDYNNNIKIVERIIEEPVDEVSDKSEIQLGDSYENNLIE
jgi:hypothetical protein